MPDYGDAEGFSYSGPGTDSTTGGWTSMGGDSGNNNWGSSDDVQDFIGVDYDYEHAGPLDTSTASTFDDNMSTGFGSWFGANTASTGSSELVQTTIQNTIDKELAKQEELYKSGQVKDKYGHPILWTAGVKNKIIGGIFNNLYPQINEMTLEEFIAAGGEEQDYLAANASMEPGFANLMSGTTPGQWPEIFESYYQPPGGGGGSSGGGPHYGGYYGSGSGGGGGSRGGGGSSMQYPSPYAQGNPHRPRWGQSEIQRRYIDRMRGMNRGGIVSLC